MAVASAARAVVRERWLRRVLVGALVGALLARRLVPRHAGDTVGERGRELLASLAAQFGPAVLASLGLWFVFSVYWQLEARHAAPAVRTEPPASRLLHLALVSLGQVLVFLPLPGLRWRFVAQSMPLIVIGLTMLVSCFALAVWARRSLGANWSGAVATVTGHRLVRGGPYRLVRHPIYTAVLGMYLGTILVSGEMHALLGGLILLVAYLRKIGLEERELTHTFGASYDDYARTSWRLVPGVY